MTQPVGPPVETTEDKETDPPERWLNRTVAGSGITSALGDFCYETTTVILPGFLAVLGLPAAALGIIEGIADAVASFTKMISGFIADKLGHRKLLVIAGLYVAVQEALEATVTAEMVDRDTVAMSVGVLGTVNGTAKFVSSTAVGILWTIVSPTFSFGLAAILMIAGTAALLRIHQESC